MAHTTRSYGSPAQTGPAPFSTSGSPPSACLMAEGIRDSVMARSHDHLVRSVLACFPSLTAEALRPATMFPAALGGRDSTGDYGLSAPLLTWGISHPTLLGVSQRFRRCSCRTCCAAVGALSTP